MYKIDSRDGTIEWAYRGSGDPAETDNLATPVAFSDQPEFRQPEPAIELNADDVFPGQILFADYDRQGIYYPATLISKEPGDSFAVLYVNGSSETVTVEDLKSDDLAPGAIVEIGWRFGDGALSRRHMGESEIRGFNRRCHRFRYGDYLGKRWRRAIRSIAQDARSCGGNPIR